MIGGSALKKLYTYIITSDNGQSPCYDDGIFTLACCKPQIRRMILQNYSNGIKNKTDDIWLCGIQRDNRNPFIVFLAKIYDVLRLEEYYGDNTLYSERNDCHYRNIKIIANETVSGKLPVKLTAEDIFKSCPDFKAGNLNEHGGFENYNDFSQYTKTKRDCIIRDISGAGVLLSKQFIHCSCFNDKFALTELLKPAFKDMLRDYKDKNRRWFHGFDEWNDFYKVIPKIDLGEHNNIKVLNPRTIWNKIGGCIVC